MKDLAGIKHFLQDDDGVTMVEYGMIAALISVVALVAVTGVGTNVNAAFKAVCNALHVTAVTGSAACA